MSCSTLEDQVYNKVIIFSNSTPYTQLFAEVISLHCVKAEKDKIVFLCSCAVSDQVLCIKSDACSQKAEQKKMCSEFRFDSRRALDGLWVSSVSRLNSLQRETRWKWLCGCCMGVETRIGSLKKISHQTFLQD